MISLIIFGALIVASIAFHEIGHALFFGKNFIKFDTHLIFIGMISANGLNSKMTVREYATMANAGWLFSLPFSIIALLFLGQAYFIMLLVFIFLGSSIDIALYFLLIIYLLFYKIKPTAKVYDISESEFGLAYWKNVLK